MLPSHWIPAARHVGLKLRLRSCVTYWCMPDSLALTSAGWAERQILEFIKTKFPPNLLFYFKNRGSPRQPLGTPIFKPWKWSKVWGKRPPPYQKAGYGPEIVLHLPYCRTEDGIHSVPYIWLWRFKWYEIVMYSMIFWASVCSILLLICDKFCLFFF